MCARGLLKGLKVLCAVCFFQKQIPQVTGFQGTVGEPGTCAGLRFPWETQARSSQVNPFRFENLSGGGAGQCILLFSHGQHFPGKGDACN